MDNMKFNDDDFRQFNGDKTSELTVISSSIYNIFIVAGS